MSDLSAFSAIKDSYRNDIVGTAKQHMSLHERVTQEERTHSPSLPQDKRNLAIFDLAIADCMADQGDGQAARVMYAEAHELMRSNTDKGLNQLSEVVRRKIP